MSKLFRTHKEFNTKFKENRFESEADFRGVKLALHSLEDCNLYKANFEKAIINKVAFTDSYLEHANFNGCLLTGNEFNCAFLYHATFRRCFFRFDDFIRTSLGEADFSHSSIYGCNFSNARLIGANFSDANLTGSTLTGANLGEIIYNENTIFPKDFNLKEHRAKYYKEVNPWRWENTKGTREADQKAYIEHDGKPTKKLPKLKPIPLSPEEVIKYGSPKKGGK